jgi:hypothetical protein
MSTEFLKMSVPPGLLGSIVIVPAAVCPCCLGLGLGLGLGLARGLRLSGGFPLFPPPAQKVFGLLLVGRVEGIDR